MEIVTVQKRKRPAGSGHWHAYELGTDSFGSWVYTPAHSTFVGDDGAGNLGSCEAAMDTDGRGRHAVVQLPRFDWFVAHWVQEADHLVSVDISTPPARSGSTWSYEDLELDPYLLPDGTFGVDDEDEFTEAYDAGLITTEELSAARRTVELVRRSLTIDGSPLVEAGRHWLATAIQCGLHPLIIEPRR